MNFYSENDPFAAAWLRELITDNFVPQLAAEFIQACAEAITLSAK